ncbi:MAG: transporter substrate-binding domain-containing protein [bacterium]|nr:transporter substrate-binding domain-containing protein [bacterium]
MRLFSRRIPILFSIIISAALISPNAAFSHNSDRGGEALQEKFDSLELYPYVSPRLHAIIKRGVLRVGMHDVYPPFRIAGKNGEVQAAFAADKAVPADSYPGIDVEVAHELARSLGVRLEILPGNIERLMEMVQKKEVDLALGGISATLSRSRFVQFADPYFITTPAVLLSNRRLPNESQSEEFARRKLRGIGDLRRLETMVLGVLARTTTHTLLVEDPEFSKHKVKAFPDRDALVKAFEDNDIDGIVADAVFITALTIEKPVYLVNAIALTQLYREEHLSPIMAYGDQEFHAVVNFFLKELRRTGRFEALERKYLESDKWVKKD